MPVRTVSRKFSHPWWGRRLFKGLWCRPTTADFGSSLRQILHTINVCLLEDKVQDRGMYLFTISYGSYAVDQRSGVVIYSWYFNAELWSTASALNRIIHNSHFKRRISLLEDQNAGPFPSRKADCLRDPRILPGHWLLFFETTIFVAILAQVEVVVLFSFASLWDGHHAPQRMVFSASPRWLASGDSRTVTKVSAVVCSVTKKKLIQWMISNLRVL